MPSDAPECAGYKNVTRGHGGVVCWGGDIVVVLGFLCNICWWHLFISLAFCIFVVCKYTVYEIVKWITFCTVAGWM